MARDLLTLSKWARAMGVSRQYINKNWRKWVAEYNIKVFAMTPHKKLFDADDIDRMLCRNRVA